MNSRTSPPAVRKAGPARLLRRTQLTASRGAVSCRQVVAAYADFSKSAIREWTGRPYGVVRSFLSSAGGTPRTRGGVRCPAAATAGTA